MDRETVGEGRVIAAENGGSVLFYVDVRTALRPTSGPRCCGPAGGESHGAALVRPVLASSAIGPIEGTLPASLAGADGERAPDLIASFAWTPGLSYCTGARAGQGVHGSMSRRRSGTYSSLEAPLSGAD